MMSALDLVPIASAQSTALKELMSSAPQKPWADAATISISARMPLSAPISEGVVPTLVVYGGTAQGQLFSLKPGQTIIGRSISAAVPIIDDQASRQHCRISIADATAQSATLEDLGSTNGTYLNGAPVVGIVPLVSGDRIAIGGHLLRFVTMDSTERAFHQELVAMSTMDPLTGLPNRRAIFGDLNNVFDLSRRHGRSMAVVLCDLDHFKHINDELGHPAGDEVLKAFAARIRSVLRDSDSAGRIGGEEFLLVLPETDLAGAGLLAERLRGALANEPVQLASGQRVVTCSLGFGCQRPSDQDGGALVARVDEALYKAKGQGRNRACPA
jgi:two-component system, cell cycle response regulator